VTSPSEVGVDDTFSLKVGGLTIDLVFATVDFLGRPNGSKALYR
jgi:hypothetical protein